MKRKHQYTNYLFQQKKKHQNPGQLRTRFAHMVFATGEEQCEEMTDQILAHPLSKNLFRKKESRIGKAGDDYLIPFSDFNKWSIILTKVFVRCSDIIIPFTQYRESIENFFLTEDYEEALNQLEQMESECGITLWGIENRIGLLCLLGRNKEAHEYCKIIVGENKSEATRKTIERFLMKYELRSYSNFIPLFKNTLHELRSAGHAWMADFLSLQLLPLEYDPGRRADNVFQSASPLSVCDIYHLYQVATLEILTTNPDEFRDRIFKSYTTLNKTFSDPQLKAIVQALISPDIPNYDDRVSSVLKSYSCGNYSDCIDIIQKFMQEEPSNTAFLEILARCHIYNGSIDDIDDSRGLAFKLSKLIAQSLLVDSDCSKHMSGIDSLLIRHNNCRWTHSVAAQKNNLFPQNQEAKLDYTSRKFILSGLPYTPKYYALSKGSDFEVDGFDETQKHIAESECIKFSNSRIYKYKLLRSIRKYADIEKAQRLLDEIEAKGFSYLPYELENIKYEFNMLKGDYNSAFRIVAECCVQNIESYRRFPLARIIDLIEELGIDIDEISIPILHYVFCLKIDSRKSYLRNEAYEDFIDSIGGHKPSVIFSGKSINKIEEFFLRNICVPHIMDICPEFESNLEILAERNSIIELLLERTPDDEQLITEKASIYDEVILEQSKLGINYGKLFVDIDALKSVRGDFYKSLFENYKRTFNVEDESPYVEFANTGLALPKGSKDKVLYEVIDSFLQDFVSNPDYGLDKYLSTDIRHGVFSNHIRSCLENEMIVTDKDSSGEYIPNKYWPEIYDYVNPAIMKKVDDALRRFSRKIDEQIARANTWMKVSVTDPDVERVFDYRLPLSMFEKLKNDFSHLEDFNDFFDELIAFTWTWTEHCANKMVEKLNGDFRANCDELFDDLVKAINRIRSGADFKVLFDSIESARNRFSEAIEHSTAWFRISKEFEDTEYTIDSLAKIAKKSFLAIKGEQGVIFKESGSLVNFTPEISPKEAKALTSALVTAYDNAVRHGLHRGTPAILQHCDVEDSSKFSIEIKNAFMLPDEYESDSNFLQVLRDKMHSEDELLMKKEGGSGLYKINRLLKTCSSKMSVSIDVADSKFVVQISGEYNGYTFDRRQCS